MPVSNTTGKLDGLALRDSGMVDRMDCNEDNLDSEMSVVSKVGVAMKADGLSEAGTRMESKLVVTSFLLMDGFGQSE